MGNLLSHLHFHLLKLNNIITRIQKSFLCSPQFNKQEVVRLAPIIVEWLWAASASTESGSPEAPLIELLQSAFLTGNIRKIYGLSAKADKALDMMLIVNSDRI